MRIPKTIANHPSVQAVVSGEDQGSDYKYWVFLKDGHQFTGGRMAGCTGGCGIDSIEDFKVSQPVPSEGK